MTVVQPNSIAGINSITVQSGNSLSIHKSDGTLIREIVAATGVSTFSSVSVGSATTTNNAGKSINIGLGASIAQHTDNSLTFGTNGDPRATIDASGNLVHGGGSSRSAVGGAQLVQVEGLTAAAGFSAVRNSNDANGPYISLAKSRGTALGAVTVIQNNDDLGALRFGGGDGTDISSEGARIEATVDGSPGGNDIPTRLTFQTTADGAAAPTERLRISADGSVSVNHTNGTSNGLLIIGKDGSGEAQLRFSSASSNTASIRLNSSEELGVFYGATEAVHIDSAGKVGIGTDDPESTLTLLAANPTLRGKDNGTLTGAIEFDTTQNTFYGYNNADITFSTHSGTSYAKRMAIDENGKIVIGGGASRNIDWEHPLQVEGTSASTSSVSIMRNSNDENPPYLTFCKSRGGSIGGETIVQDNDLIANIQFKAADGNSGESTAAGITAEVDGTPGDQDMPGRLVFKTSPDGSANALGRMWIKQNGRTGIGTDNPLTVAHFHGAGSGGPVTAQRDTDTASHINFRTGTGSGTLRGSIGANSGSILSLYNGSSTERIRFGTSGEIGVGGAGSISFGTAGKFLRSGGNSAGCTWADPGGGIDEADIWRLTTSFQGNASGGFIGSNWERGDTDGQNHKGTGMSESSGVFTFPSTGFWFVQFTFNMTTQYTPSQPHSHRNTGYIQTCIDGSSYAVAASSASGIYNFGSNSYPSHGTGTASIIFDVTSTSNCKCRFNWGAGQGSETCTGDTSSNQTYVTFIRLADT